MKENTCNRTYRKHTLIKAFGMTALVFLILVGAAGAAPFVYITNYGSGNISIIDTATNKVTASVPIAYENHWLAVSPDGVKVYITSDATEQFYVFDTVTNNVTVVPMMGYPGMLVVSPDGKKVYAADGYGVAVIDTATNKITAEVSTGLGIAGIAVAPDGKTVYTSNPMTAGGEVIEIDTSTNNIKAIVDVGYAPGGIAASADGKKVYVANIDSNDVSVIDTTTNNVTATVPVGTEPLGVAITPDGTKVYVTNMGEEIGNTVSVIDTASNKVISNVTVGTGPNGVVVTPDGKEVYVANTFSNNVSVIDTSTNTVIASVTVGSDPWGVGILNVPSKTQITLPVANFTANVTEGYAPLSVKFTDLSTNATGWKWDFGDGNTSNAENPMHTYDAVRNYTVNLTVSNEYSTDSKLATINVQPPSIVTLSFNPQKLELNPSSSQNVQIVMDKVPASGLAGYNVTVYVLDPAIANITAVSPPSWSGVSSNSTVPSGSVWITAVDTSGQVKAGDTNVSFGNITIIGEKAGTTNLSIVPTEVDDNNGILINPNVVNGKIIIGQLVPFPGCIFPPPNPGPDGLIWDINGNGRLDFGDVVTYFNNMAWITQNGLVTYFDYNRNGRIDFSDVLTLFNKKSL